MRPPMTCTSTHLPSLLYAVDRCQDVVRCYSCYQERHFEVIVAWVLSSQQCTQPSTAHGSRSDQTATAAASGFRIQV